MCRSGQTPLNSEGNSAANAKWTNLPELTIEDSRVDLPPTDYEGFEELVTKGGIGDMRLCIVSRLLLF